MTKKVDIKSSETFSTVNSKNYYRGTSFHYSGEGKIGIHYFSDQFTVDYVVINNCLLACKKSHLSSVENKPTDFIRNYEGRITGLNSKYGDLVIVGFDGRMAVKHGTTEYGNSMVGFIPIPGEIIVYDDYQLTDDGYIPGVKVGTGNGYVQDLCFIDQDLRSVLEQHLNDTFVHITQVERERGNNKLNMEDEIREETLILNRL